jgi:hypothetical protein
VRNQMPSIQMNLDLDLGFAYLHAAPDPVHRNRVAHAEQRQIALDIHQPLVLSVYFRNPRRQWFQV